MSRWAWAEVSASAIERNVATLVRTVAPAELWAVVKANGYGHGAVLAAHAALAGGASGLCVALVQEGVHLRKAGITAPILVLSEQPADQLPAAVRHDLQLTVYSLDQVLRLEGLSAHEHPVHLKVDTGMRRVGAAAGDALLLADAIGRSPATRLEGLCTHLAVADETAHPFTGEQLDRFDRVIAALAAGGHHPRCVHAANSAAAIAHPRSRYGMVRAGIAVYGISPGHDLDAMVHSLALQPALALKARVSFVKRVRSGDRISYGLRYTFASDVNVATLPIGYADGVPRRLHDVGGAVLIGGRRRRIVGAITMDQLMVDCGHDDVRLGDEAVLLGDQGQESIRADEWADRLGTIPYEIVCGVSPRVERRRI